MQRQHSASKLLVFNFTSQGGQATRRITLQLDHLSLIAGYLAFSTVDYRLKSRPDLFRFPLNLREQLLWQFDLGPLPYLLVVVYRIRQGEIDI